MSRTGGKHYAAQAIGNAPGAARAATNMIEEANDAVPETPRERDASERPPRPAESGGPKGPEPTRYGDWEKNGRCIDFQGGQGP
ncbi:MAG TPA: DUF1674 domain-containing protein [Candidatus Saccharimonadia bacterium]|nr:DUF1674 domain-containing protein [Candidatus Saccharimonadia bacterium]